MCSESLSASKAGTLPESYCPSPRGFVKQSVVTYACHQEHLKWPDIIVLSRPLLSIVTDSGFPGPQDIPLLWQTLLTGDAGAWSWDLLQAKQVLDHEATTFKNVFCWKGQHCPLRAAATLQGSGLRSFTQLSTWEPFWLEMSELENRTLMCAKRLLYYGALFLNKEKWLHHLSWSWNGSY